MTLSPLRVLAVRALSSVARHALFYIVIVLATIACFALVTAAWHSPAAEPFVDFTAVPLLDTIVITIALADLRGTRSPAAVWSRVLERTWATILLTVAANFIAWEGIASLVGGFVDKLYAIFFLLVSATIVYAPVVAVVDDETPWWMLVWRAFGASVRTAIGGANFARALMLFILQFLPVLIGAALQAQLAAHHVARAEFWGNVPIGMLLEPPLVALVAFTYFDAAGMPPSDACSE